jgi:uncharacterized YigZ family protein
MERLLIPEREARAELLVVNSRFIAAIAPAFTVEEARAFIARIKAEFVDATHHVPAFIIGHGASVVAHCQDDGEPSGTAGRPALAVLRGSGLGDVVVVVTRYFGGTKLGTGGLVRAYSDAVREVLTCVPLAEKVATHTILLEAPYSYFERIRQMIEACHGQVIEEAFAAEVTITARFTLEALPDFQLALSDLSNGTLEALIVETDEATIMPLGITGIAAL